MLRTIIAQDHSKVKACQNFCIMIERTLVSLELLERVSTCLMPLEDLQNLPHSWDLHHLQTIQFWQKSVEEVQTLRKISPLQHAFGGEEHHLPD